MTSAAARSPHRWSFFRAGGVDQVRLDKGADILHLDQLDQKLWVALSCPTQGLEIDPRTMALLDTDNDGHVRPPELLGAIAWLRQVLANPDCLVEGRDGVALADLRQDTDEGKAVAASARHVLDSLGQDKAVITVADASRTADFFAAAKRNGDGVVPPSSIDDEKARAVAADIVRCTGGAPDRSGQPGYDQATLEAFFAACQEYDAWWKVAETDAATVLPFGEATPAAHVAFAAVRAKIDDYFGRCRLAAFDERALVAVNREEQVYMAAAAKDLSITADEVRPLPLARVAPNQPLPLVEGVNPAWSDAIAAFRSHCCTGKQTLAEADWLELCAKFAAHEAWVANKAGAAVEPLGKQRVREILGGGTKAVLQRAIEEDLAVAAEVAAMANVERLAHLHRDLLEVLRNYVNFADFYARRGAIFQAGTLYIDGRATEMCFLVQDAAKHLKMAALANAYLAYVDCTRAGGEKISIACAITAGDSDNLFEGRNGVFYDRKGRDWDATITKIVTNPISIRQAFWSPYKKVQRAIQEAVAKRAAAAEGASTAKLQAGADAAGTAVQTGQGPPKPKFDVGTIAALGVAVAGITGVFTALLTGFLGLGPWIPLGIIGLLLAISGPSMVIAWMKLRTRNLGPILDANGWAVNTLTRINIPLGTSLTALPRIPPGSHRSLVDPYGPKRRVWPRVLFVLFVLAAIGYALYRTNVLHRWFPGQVPAHHAEIGLEADKKKAKPGEAITFTVHSGATKLQVTDTTDRDRPVEWPAIDVAGGKAALVIPADAKPGALTVHDAVSGTQVGIEIEAP